MNCPVCGMEVDDAQFCPGCGANMSAFEGVSQDKVIINQTPEQQMAAGDDSVTQLIPENYMNSTGDDSVTQLIPENYMSAQGDDTATVMLDPSQVQQRMPNQQPAFAQQSAYNQAPYSNQAAPAYGYQQPYGQPQMGYQSNANIHPSYGPKKASGGIKVYSLICLISLLLVILVSGIFMTKPIFYIFQSYVGGTIEDEEIIEELESDDEYEDAANVYRVLIGAMIVFAVIGAINAWVAYARINTGCMKSPINKSVGAFVFAFLAFAIIAFLTFGLGEEIENSYYGFDYGASGYRQFNVYDLCFYVTLVATLVNMAGIFTSASAKNNSR